MRKITTNKGGYVNELSALVTGLVVVGMVLVVGFLIMAEGKSIMEEDITNANESTIGVNASIDTIEAMNDIPGWLTIIVVAVIGAVLLGLVSMYRRRS